MKSWAIRTMVAASAALAWTSAARADDPQGLYTTIGGLFVLQEDATAGGDPLFSGAEVDFDDGFGVSVGLGYDLPGLPIAVEFEYSYRNAETETITFGGPGGPIQFDADLGSHTFMVHGILNFQIEGTPIGLYAGAGAGFTLSTLEVSSIAGLPVTGDADEEDVTLAYQIRAGLTFRVSDNVMLYAGARWFDALDPEFDGVELDNQSVNIEAGIRLYF
ncbi:MAG: outer membrane beta-barrel protein [Phycisphaerales bacterium]|nr:outer membrane beta-barrel protein [Phycisphaerales bacterium]MCI0674450.1 outer membrane beta-barrel protein [Phycisphaerales bacterium]